jgi:tRNA nucleotidyltransferase/poly(A) polymerase
VIARLRKAGFRAYFAGGCVRDRLLGHEPADFDVATDAPASTVQELFKRTVPVGVQFGVVLVLMDDQPIEVATFRADAHYEDGRHPVSVRFTDPEEDARRRDFTINGMFFDPETDEVIDYVGGRADLAARIIRAIGNPRDRFHEDRLRMLRAVRFAARLDYDIEPATWAAMRDLAGEITGIAWERIGDEIIRILTEGRAARGFTLLDQCNLLEHVLPEIANLKGVAQSPDYHPEGDVFTHTLLLLEQLRAPSETLALGCLLHDVAKPMCARSDGSRITFYGHCEEGEKVAVAVCQRLRRSSAVWERVGYLVRNHLRLVAAPNMRRSTLRRFLAEDGIEELLELARYDALASNKDLRFYTFCRAQQAAFGSEPIKPPPLVRGRDLLSLGYAPGPRFAVILQAVEDKQLEGDFSSLEDALAWVQREYPRAEEDRGDAETRR